MDGERDVDDRQRRLVLTAGGAVGLAAAVASVVPFVKSMGPSERTKAAGAPVEVDISNLKSGQMLTVEWRGKPVWILSRTPEMLASLATVAPQLADPASERSIQPDACRNEARSIRPEIMVALGVCTHLGCSPKAKFGTGIESGLDADWQGGFYCPCHGSTFDLAGRVFKDKLAPSNLVIPPYRFAGDNRIIIGEEEEKA
ncbi:MAG: ubiquinol-cytochrome c reductase iron-sulfur subunit [Gammaproteobacteria bacterium]|nr:ubiquinol-cytochrome c reductase iron-sulfur subunit [Gammaproteobacteria bacterium]